MDFLSTLSAHLCGGFKFILIDNFCVSTLIFEVRILPFLFFKATFRECDRYFILFLHFCFLYQLLFPLTLYSLPESLSDAFLGWFGVGEMGCDIKYTIT